VQFSYTVLAVVVSAERLNFFRQTDMRGDFFPCGMDVNWECGLALYSTAAENENIS
jgi:hypothetical protein